MGLTKRSESNRVYLQVKHSCLWREFKQATKETVAVEVTNPSNGKILTKHGIPYENVSGHVVAIDPYKREFQGKKFVGFKVHFQEGGQVFVVDMPYQSQVFRRFLKILPNINWALPLSLSIFQGKGKDNKPELGVWFRQSGKTIKPFYTREEKHGMPEARQDPVTQDWDFRDQHRWLVEKLLNVHIPAVKIAAAMLAPPVEPAALEDDAQDGSAEDTGDAQQPYSEITDDDVPF